MDIMDVIYKPSSEVISTDRYTALGQIRSSKDPIFIGQIVSHHPDLMMDALIHGISNNILGVVDKYITWDNAIEAIVRASSPYQRVLYEEIYSYLDYRGMHPDWFDYYTGYWFGREENIIKNDPITQPNFWRKVGAVAAKYGNDELLQHVLSEHHRELTPQMIQNLYILAGDNSVITRIIDRYSK